MIHKYPKYAPQTEGFHVLKTIGSFIKDGTVADKVRNTKTQVTSTRDTKLQDLMSHIGIAVDNVRALHKSTEHWQDGWKTMWSKEGWSGLWKKITGAREFQTGIATAVATGTAAIAEGASGGTLGAIGAFILEADQQALGGAPRRVSHGRLGRDRQRHHPPEEETQKHGVRFSRTSPKRKSWRWTQKSW